MVDGIVVVGVVVGSGRDEVAGVVLDVTGRVVTGSTQVTGPDDGAVGRLVGAACGPPPPQSPAA